MTLRMPFLNCLYQYNSVKKFFLQKKDSSFDLLLFMELLVTLHFWTFPLSYFFTFTVLLLTVRDTRNIISKDLYRKM